MRNFDSWFRSLWREYLRPWVCREDPAQISLFDRTTLFLMVVTCFWYFVAYLCNDSIPDVTADGRPGWCAWWDQGEYYKATAALAHGELQPSPYWIGYPLFGVPFYWLMPRHSYFVPNLIMVLGMVCSFFASCRHFMGRLEAWALVVILFFADPVMRDGCLIVPWNTLPAYAALYLSVYLLLIRRGMPAQYALCAFFIGMAVLSRPTEVIPLSVLYLLAVLGLMTWRRRAWALAFFGLSGAGGALFICWLNIHFYGHWNSPYMASEKTKFSMANYGLKVYQLLCDGTFLTGHAAESGGVTDGVPTAQILERFPFFLFLLPGAIYLVKARGAKALGLLLAIVSTVAFYLTYNPVNNPPYFWIYCSYHYIWWIIPWLGFLSYLSFRQAFFVLPRGWYLTALLAPVFFFFLISFKTVAVASSDAAGDRLPFTTAYTGQSYTVNLVAPMEMRVMDLHFVFETPPSYQGTAADSAAKVLVTVNGERKVSMVDYMMSQDGDAFDFCFLPHDLRLKPGDPLTVVFNETREPKLIRASLLDVVFRLGRPVHFQ